MIALPTGERIVLPEMVGGLDAAGWSTKGGTWPLWPLQWRVTDATRPDEDNNVWLTNFIYQGERFEKKDGTLTDIPVYPDGRQVGCRPENDTNSCEALVEVALDDRTIRPTLRSVSLQGPPNKNGWNWEGIARWPKGEQDGVLVVNDEFTGAGKGTWLAWVPVP